MSLICRSCDQPIGTLHLDTCPLRQPFMGAIVSVYESIRVHDPERRKEDK